MSKSYSDGYSLGKTDGEHGENKLPSRAWVRSFSNIGSYLPGAENRDDEWRKGYRQGFEDQVRVLKVAAQNEGDNSVERMGLGGQLPPSVETFSTPVASSTGNNTFAHRIAVARNLYEQMVRVRQFLYQTDDDFRTLFALHEVLAGEFFNDLLTYHIRPRQQQLAQLASNVQSNDQPAAQALVEKYELAIQGLERGQAAASAYFTAINLSAVGHLSGVSAALGNGDPRDYETQLEVAYSIRQVFEALLRQLDGLGRAYDACVRDHDELMRQDFDAIIRRCIDPRLQEVSDLWRVVRDQDMCGIDDVISRLRTVSSV